MLKKALLAIFLTVPFAAGGYFAEPYLFRPPPVETAMHVEGPRQKLFKMPLGKFTLQVVHKKRILHMLFDVDVYIEGSANFERMNGAMGRTTLRDTTISELSQMSETALWLNTEDVSDLDRRFLAEQIVRQLNRTFPMVKTARVNEFASSISARE